MFDRHRTSQILDCRTAPGSDPHFAESPSPESTRGRSSVVITVVESQACHFCADAHTALEELSQEYPMTIESVDVRSAPGTALVQRHGATMSPLVLVDGIYFSHGRLPRKKLQALLEAREEVSRG